MNTNKIRPADSEETQQLGSPPKFKGPPKGKAKSGPRPPKAQKAPSVSQTVALTVTSSTAPDGSFYPDLLAFEEAVLRSYEAMTAFPTTQVRWLVSYRLFFHMCFQYLYASWLAMYSKEYTSLGIPVQAELRCSPAKLQMVFENLTVPSTVREAMLSTLAPVQIAGARFIPAPPRICSVPADKTHLGSYINYHVWFPTMDDIEPDKFVGTNYHNTYSLGIREPHNDQYEEAPRGVEFLETLDEHVSTAFGFAEAMRVYPRLFLDFAASIKSANFPTTNFAPFDSRVEPALEKKVTIRQNTLPYLTSPAHDRSVILRSESPMSVTSSLTQSFHMGLVYHGPDMAELLTQTYVPLDPNEIFGKGTKWQPLTGPISNRFAFSPRFPPGERTLSTLDKTFQLIADEFEHLTASGHIIVHYSTPSERTHDYGDGDEAFAIEEGDSVDYYGEITLHIAKDKQVVLPKVHLVGVPIKVTGDGNFYSIVSFSSGYIQPTTNTVIKSFSADKVYPQVMARPGSADVDFLLSSLARIFRCSSSAGPWLAKIIGDDLSKRY